MNIEAVIGANYGDEGKGLFTDYLCANRPNPIVVMTNGGSQRGHTVELEDGTRHVFHHFGSGTLRGAPTYFPKQYLLNPMQFAKEYEELEKLGHRPVSFRHPDCILQLPCDIALNWHIEKARGENKHGSVGCGIWETKYRMYNGDSITVDRFCSMSYSERHNYIKDQAKKYRDLRCKEEYIDKYAEIYDLFLSNSFIDHYISDVIFMRNKCSSGNLKLTCDAYNIKTVVFENGQGLKLDQLYGGSDEANTTPSFTGSIGIAQILNEECLNEGSVNLNYISRTYLTKHGAGHFAEQNYMPSLDTSKIKNDETNVWNEWQDSLRYSKLDYDALFKRCERDIVMFNKFLDSKAIVSKSIVMTHANEVEVNEKCLNKVNFISRSKLSKDIILKI